MKQFAKYMLILLCLVFVLDRCMGYIFNKLYMANRVGTAGGKINYYLSLKKPPELLVMGSSRALLNVIPDSFKVSCYNLGHEGMDDAFQAGLLDIIINHKKIPHTILLHIDPQQYSFLNEDTYSANIQKLEYYYGKDPLVTQYINEISGHERFFFLFNLYRYNGRAINVLKDVIKTRYFYKPDNGFEPMPPAKDDSINTVTLSRQLKVHIGQFKMNRLRYLFKFIELCKQNRIRLIIFTSPFYNNPYKEPPQLDSVLRSQNIPYINYQVLGLPAVENRPSLWKDPAHLNYIGAQYESGDLAKRVMKLMRTGAR